MHKPLLIQYFLHILLACSLQIHFPLLHAQEISVRPIPMLDKLPVKAIHRIFQDSERIYLVRHIRRFMSV